MDCIFAKKGLLLAQYKESADTENAEILEFEAQIQTLQNTLLAMLTRDYNKAEFDTFKSEAMQNSGLKGKAFFKPLRFLLTGHTHGPELSDLFPILRLYLKDIVRN